jgi:hypothetical protein
MRNAFEDDLPLADPWFSYTAGAVLDSELDDQWFSRGRPISSRPPPNESAPDTSKEEWGTRTDSDFRQSF